jgi:MFS family permease
VLHGGAHTLGWLTGASGIGALISGLSLAVRKSVVGLTRMLQIAAAMLGGALILFGLSHTLWLSLVLMVFVGFGLMQGAAVSNTIIQSLVPEDKRARVMSYYTMAFFGAAPFGSLLAGSAGSPDRSAPHRHVTGAFCVAGSLWFTYTLPKVRAVMRPIYQEMGITTSLVFSRERFSRTSCPISCMEFRATVFRHPSRILPEKDSPPPPSTSFGHS